MQRGGIALVLRLWVVDCMGFSSSSGRVYVEMPGALSFR